MYTSFAFNLSPDRLLFLDIDGVVNTLMIYSGPIEGRKMNKKDGYYFDLCSGPRDKRVSNEFAVRWLSKLCLEYNLKIVITSSWLIGSTLKKIEKALRNSGLDPRVEIIDEARAHNLTFNRGVQIEAWLNKNNYNIDNSVFIILDDDNDMNGFKRDLSSYLIKCDNSTGFGLKEYTKACTLLDDLIQKRENFYFNEKEN